MHSNHKIVKCKNCGTIVSQCRCFDLNKVTELIDSCDACKSKVLKFEGPKEQRTRIAEAVSQDIIKLGEAGEPNELIGLHMMNWLIDARVESENLRKAHGKS